MKHHETPKPASPESIKQGYEVSDMGFKVILIFGIIISSATVLSMIAMVFFFGALENYAPSTSAYVASPLASDDAIVIEVQSPVESNPVRDRLAIEAEAKQALNEYAWVSEEGGIARIPIEATIALVAAHKALPKLAPIESIVGPQAPPAAIPAPDATGNVESPPVGAAVGEAAAADVTGEAADAPPPVVQE